MQLQLTPEERALLTDLIERTLSETRVEVRHTAQREWRDRLHGEAEQLRGLLERLRQLA